MQRSLPPPLPVTTVGGYLGAGKTTLINHLLRNNQGKRLAVLVNEFGDLSIDEDLIEAREDDLISLSGGCICCAFGDDLSDALETLAKRDPSPHHILIECSGVAIPGAVVALVDLLSAFRTDATLVLVDSETIQEQAQNPYIGDTISRQLDQADILIANKIDLLDPKSQDRLRHWLKTQVPMASLIETEQGQVSVELLLGAIAEPKEGQADTHADAHFQSVTFRDLKAQTPETLVARLRLNDLGLVRAKGFFADRKGQTFALQLVGQRCTIEPSDGQQELGLVCIGLKDVLNVPALSDFLAREKA